MQLPGTQGLRKILKLMRQFKIYSIWLQANQQTDRHTRAHAQCSPASVGLAQARPNQYTYLCKLHSKVSSVIWTFTIYTVIKCTILDFVFLTATQPLVMLMTQDLKNIENVK